MIFLASFILFLYIINKYQLNNGKKKLQLESRTAVFF